MVAATKPEGVFEKVRESRHFLAQVANHENDPTPGEFLTSLSAFLSAFRTIGNRLCGVVRHKHGKAKAQWLNGQLKNHPEIGFLIEQRDIEVHGNGATVFPRFAIHPAPLASQLRNKYNDRYADRFASRFAPAGVGIRFIGGWQFAGNPKNLIELGHDALDAMEVVIRQALA